MKAMLKRKCYKHSSKVNWDKFKKQRNLVSDLKRKSMHTYFDERCNISNQSKNPKQFWDTICPFFSDKGARDYNISLLSEDKLIANQQDVCELFNDYFINVGTDANTVEDVPVLQTVQEIIDEHREHPSTRMIEGQQNVSSSFNFHSVKSNEVFCKLRALNPSKSCGYDGIPARLIKLGASILCNPIATIINNCLKSSTFPNELKKAEVSPVYKKGEVMDIGNYRPVSVLSTYSKVFEGIINDQLRYF